jgi:hypothetical protein
MSAAVKNVVAEKIVGLRTWDLKMALSVVRVNAAPASDVENRAAPFARVGDSSGVET